MFKSWNDFFNSEKKKDYFNNLMSFVDNEYKTKTIYPPKELMFNAFKLCPLDKVKVVIVGQDPYHEDGQAMGLSFSVPEGVKIPPSLVNIYKEIENDFNVVNFNTSGDLTYLAKQGVLLLNSILTVEQGKPLSHNNKEYKELYKNILLLLNDLDQPIVFMLWGGKAKECKKYLNNINHFILEANHPSPLSANQGGWFGLKLFSQCNNYLKEHHVEPIEWLNN